MAKGEVRNLLIVELDMGVDEAIDLVTKLAAHVGGFKIGFQLMTEMFASVESEIGNPDEMNENLLKVYRLFNLLGRSFPKVMQFVEEAQRAGYDGIICTPQGLALVGKRVMLSTDVADPDTVGYYFMSGRPLLLASDSIGEVEKSKREMEEALKELMLT